MLTEPLPNTLDVRKAAVREAVVSGVLKPTDLQRFRELLAADEGLIEVNLSFGRDEENRYLIRVDIEADVQVICQRCLSVMPEHLSCDNTLAVVWTDDQAVALPRHLDPLIADEQPCELWAVVEEELMLAMKPFSYHDTEDCKKLMSAYSDPPPVETVAQDKPNPFDVLAQLKPDKKH